MEAKRTEEAIFSELSAVCRQSGYAHAIAFLCFRDNVIAFQEEVKPEDMLRLFSLERLLRTEISTLIGLLVKGDIDYDVPSLEIIQDYVEQSDRLLKELHEVISSSMALAALSDGISDERKVASDPGTWFREPIFYGGESAYSFQYRELAAQRYREDGPWLRGKMGFTIDSAVEVARAIQAIQNKKAAKLQSTASVVASSVTTMLPCHIFSSDEITEEIGLPREEVESVLQAFTFEGGNEQFESLDDFNATNAAPLIRVDGHHYLLFQYYSFVEALYESPYFWMVRDASYRPLSSDHRGRFTETFAAERLASVFGEKNVHRNVDLVPKKGVKIGEIDVLVEHGDRLIVLQAKSKRLTLAARKGNVASIREDFKKAIQDSYDQAMECAKHLIAADCRLLKSGDTEIRLASRPKEIFLLCVVADHYPALSAQSRQFLQYEAVPGVSLPFVMDVFLLDAMTEMLNSPLRLLSYVRQRTAYAERVGMTHELTVLAYHLKHNLWLDDDDSFVSLGDDISVELDIAMSARRDGMPGVDTPAGLLTRFAGTTFERLVKQIEDKALPTIIDLGLMLLTADQDSCQAINDGVEHIVGLSRSDRRLHDFTIGFGKWSEGLTIHCSTAPPAEAAERLRGHCYRRKYAEKADRWYGLCLDIDRDIRFGVVLDYKWEHSEEMTMLTSSMRVGRPSREISALLRVKATKKVGRNDPCPCGSGLKYKRCCLN